MRLAIADPPYLGRANRWYGTGRGCAGGRGRADSHPDARRWDTPAAHFELVDRLEASYDGWALFCGAAALPVLAAHAPAGVLVLSWVVTNAPPSGARVLTGWEPVLARIPAGREAHGTGPATRTAHVAPAPRVGFAGAKPESVTHWLLDVLGYDAETDTLEDLFPGSGAVAAAAAQLRLTV